MARIIFYFYILLLCVYSVYSESPPIGNLPPQQNRKIKDAEDSLGTKDDGKGQEKQIIPEINVNIGKRNDNNTDGTKKSENNTNGGKSDDKKDKTISSNSSTTKTLVNSNIKTNTNTEIESGAVMRGIFVFVGITMICIMYIGFKTYFK